MKPLNLAAVLLLCLSVGACTTKVVDKVRVIPAEEPDTEQSGKPSQERNRVRAEKLISSAEELLTPVGFMLADQLVDAALKNDPSNRKAQFYKALLGPMMKTRGMLSRLGPLRAVFAQFYLKYGRVGGELGNFLRDPTGGNLITNEAELQAFLAEVLDEQTKLADFIARNKTFIARIAVSHVHNYDRLIQECSVHKISNNTYRITPCPHMLQLPLKVNRGDWEALYQMANGARMALAASLSYDAEGSLEFNRRRAEFKTAKARNEFLSQQPKLGKLKADHQLDTVKSRALDTYTGMKWVLGLQGQLCNEENPRSEHLFRTICIKKPVAVGPADVAAGPALDLLRMGISARGGKVRAVKPFEGGISGRPMNEVHMDVMALFKFPLADLRTLLPRAYDNCGSPTALQDPTFGGTFPSANAEEFLLSSSFCEVNP